MYSAKQREEDSILMTVMELEVEGRRTVGRPKKTWSKVVEEDEVIEHHRIHITEDRHQCRRLTSHPTTGVGN